ncbi:MAG: hypothetical protein IMZ62_15930 [Chloroflexi bacterium]|nr:hypothetical protein [Chloroflexota bacterium]
MSKLIIEVECGEKECGPGCPWAGSVLTHWEPDTRKWMECRLWGKNLPHKKRGGHYEFNRCPACLAAEEKVNAIERRYAELVETVASRTDQNAKGEK